MPRSPRYDALFKPMRIGPKRAKNRFFQMPHASGGTNAAPQVRTAFRGMKADGGRGVVCAGACSVERSSDDFSFSCEALWDEVDVCTHALMTDAVHAHGRLAGVELWQDGAAVRAERAGFDILCVYAGMGYLPCQVLMRDDSHRTDAHGGSGRNRVRLEEELIDTLREATHGRCAVALGLSMQELRAHPSEVAASKGHEVITLLRDAPDLFDVQMAHSATDCAASRFTPEGSHEPVVDFVKSLTDKPVVGMGCFTSPDTMVGMIRFGVLDFIGGACPCIADPFLPAKIDEGRERIGCNTCSSSWHHGVWVRCTQNPTAGEEWQRGWHPEKVRKEGAGSVLVVGGGPAAVETADLAAAGIRSLHQTGEANAPGAVAHAVYQRHKTAQGLGRTADAIRAGRDAPFAPRDFHAAARAAQ
jgi:dimethylamine/trimethylamine dehydrogenase